MLDMIIRGGMVFDGALNQPYTADIGIRDGHIASIGEISESAAQVVDATGLIITPGFVDVHTHYDGQATWDPYLTPSCLHGVTTVVMGNCGVGFAPVREQDRDWLIRLMEGVEDIPGTVLSEGIKWQWETFPEYLQALKNKPFAVDVATQIPHGPLRTYVMGARGAEHTARPEPHEIRAMASLVEEALLHGAVGFTTSRTVAHRSSDGTFTPSLTATPQELLAIARAMKNVGRGIIEIVSDFVPLEEEFALIHEIATVSQRPVSLALTQTPDQPDAWRRILQLIEAACDDGLTIHAQVAARPISVLMGLPNNAHFLMASATYRDMLALPLSERLEKLLQPSIKAQILADLNLADLPAPMLYDWKNIYRFADDMPYFPNSNQSVENVAQHVGDAPASIAYDWLVENDGKQFLFLPVRNFVEGNDRALRAMLESAHTVVGLGDAGAHCGVLCDASMPTFFLTHWQQQGFSLEWLVHQLSQRPALAWGFNDRGTIEIGKRADINVIDRHRLRLNMPAYENDLPANGRRLMQRAEGYVMTLVNGIPIVKEGEPTGAFPGKLIAN